MALHCAPFTQIPGNDSLLSSEKSAEYCRQMTAICVPCAYLWLLAPAQAYHTRHATGLYIPWTGLNVMKIILGVLLILSDCCYFMTKFTSINDQEYWSPVEIVEPLVTSFTLILVIFLMEYGRRRGHRSSLIVFVFWFLLSFTNITGFVLTFETVYLDNISFDRSLLLQFIHSSVCMPLTLGELILSSIKDTPSSENEESKNDGTQNEQSIIPRLFFTWFEKYNLDNEPILHPDDSIRSISGAFQWIYSLQNKRSLRLRLSIGDIFRTLFCINQWQYRRMKHELTQLPMFEPSLWPVWFQLFSGEILLGYFVFFCSDLLLWSGPVLLGFLMNAASRMQGFVYVALIFFLGLLQTILRSQAVFILTNTNLKIHSLFLSTAYKKVLAATSSTSVVSLEEASAHAHRIQGSLVQVASLLTAPVQISIKLFMLNGLLGKPALILIPALLLINVLLSIANTKIEITKEFWSSSQSSRNSQLISKGLLTVQMLKCYGWDGTFYHQVRSCHANDMIFLKRLLTWKTIIANIMISFPIIMHVVILLIIRIVSSTAAPEADRFYISLAIILVFRHHSHKLYVYIKATIEMVHAFNWLSNFLQTPDLDEDFPNLDFSTNFAIRVQSGRFTWSPDRLPALKNVNLEVLVGQLAVVIGSPHSGKSSLLNCLLREMIRLRGKITTMGRITYVSQNPWLRSGTIRDNILFGHPPNDFFYDEVVKACHLTPVFQKFEKRDLTLIQPKSLTIDRKIQQQICLARALFTNADIYLLDNIIQDFDTTTGTNIFRDVIGPNGLLGKKTRLVVLSSSSPFVKEADVIIKVNNGKVTSNQYRNLGEDDEDEEDYFSLEPESSDEQTGHNIRNDKSVKTSTHFGKSPSVLMSCCYFCFENNGCLGPLVTLLLFSAVHGLSLGFQVFIRSYINSSMPLPTKPFQSFFAGGCLIFFIVTILSGINQKNFFSAAADKWHERTIATLLRVPRFTFGLLLRKYPRWLMAADLLSAIETFAPAIHQLINNYAMALTLVFIICLCITPFWFILPFAIFLFICIQIYYCKIHRVIMHKCIQANQPILDHFGETVHGLETIRAFQRQHEFLTELEHFLDASHTAHIFFVIGARWLVIRTDSLAYLIIAMVGVIAVASSVTSSSIGLALISAFGLIHILRELILVGCDIQKTSGAITRLHEIMKLPLEPPWRNLYRPGVRWPETGAISFRGFVCCRPKSLHLLLRGITCDIKSEEKVGIIGDSEEVSAIGHVLLRLVDGMTGSIFIDGIDISQIGLYDLRSRLTLITKDVMCLMPGTLWRNLDPQKQHLVEDVQVTVRMSRLQSFVSSLQRGLMHELNDDDPHLNDEIRLQICLARALLRKSKILIIDLDMIKKFPRVHQLIRAILRCAFAQSTILYLTSNYEMVDDCNRIMILESGSIKAFDEPPVIFPTNT